MKIAKKPKVKAVKEEDRASDYAARLTELETELIRYPSLGDEASLKTVLDPKEVMENGEKVVHFSYHGKPYSVGHADRTFADSHHARGVRHIRFYSETKEVLCIEGDFEDQQFGSNFKFHNVEVYLVGEWEKDFLALSDELIQYKAKRRQAFQKKRAAETARKHR